MINDAPSIPLIFLCFNTCLFFFAKQGAGVDNIAPNQLLFDNGQTIVSADQSFELGFFSPWSSSSRYIAIWFTELPRQSPVWIANRDSPLSDFSGVLTLTSSGNILITDNRTETVAWSSNSSSPAASDPVLQLLDTGNLVVKNGVGSQNYLWQSFEHPCDSLIQGMRLGWDLRNNQEWYLRSWKSLDDPSSGDFTYRVDPQGLPQLLLRQGSTLQYRSGPWDGARFGGGPPLVPNGVITPAFVINSSYLYYSFVNSEDTALTKFTVNQAGLLQQLIWNEEQRDWVDVIRLQMDGCDDYGHCGPFGICDANANPICQCPDGFTPRFPENWDKTEWSGGCVRRKPLNDSANNCSSPEEVGFRRVPRLKLPDTSNYFLNRTANSARECEEACLRNCSCVAYARTQVSGCVVWFGNLLDMRHYHEGGQDVYIRMDASELRPKISRRRRRRMTVVSVILGLLVLGIISWYAIKWAVRRSRARGLGNNPSQDNDQNNIADEDLELPLFDLVALSIATNDFSLTNKIGEGGFGAVYRGRLSTGQDIAVKRLSIYSGQGLKEFKNEVILIAKLQHRNLVRLLGCCIHAEERMLIYEYMPNKSLDLFIFNQTRGISLGWQKRFDIIVGIARGLLYLHRDSRLRIIHRDLKASNILLDSEMIPKISDFGMARTFGGDHSEENTKRIMGTYGYMSPEYAMDGFFSVKSDVFSFGVLTLEIVSGKKNRGFFHPDHDLNLLGHAWKLWTEGNPRELMDTLLESEVDASGVVRCIHVGLLCVQQRPEDRPLMSSVLLMLDSDSPILPQPKQPGFYSERFPVDTDSSSTGKMPPTPNEVTVSMLLGR